MEKGQSSILSSIVESFASTLEPHYFSRGSVSDKIMKEEYISKWNGVMPKFVGDSSSMMFSLNGEK